MRRRLWVLVAASGVAGLFLALGPVKDAIRGSELDTRLRIVKRHVEGLGREAPACAASPAGLEPVSLLLIAVDTLRADHLGFLGYPRPVSPNLDALAADSLVFEQAVAPAPWTTPSFAGVFTGLPPGALGIAAQPLPLPREVRTLAEVLCAAGWRTAGVVSHTYVGSRYGFDRGFEQWDETHAGGHAYVSSPGVTKAALARLDELASAGRPFFLLVHYFDPHFDYTEHEGFRFSDGAAGRVRSEHDNIGELRRMAREGELGESDLRYLRDCYDSEIAYTDHYIGELLSGLRERGLYDDTLIVFLADHGEMFAEREEAWIGHSRFLYQSLIHVPLLVKEPRSARTGRVARRVSTSDVPATVLDVLGGAGGLPGRSLLDPQREPEPVFSQTRQGGRWDAVVDGSWKLIRDPATRGGQLFDLAVDPGERHDLAAEHPDRVARLEARIDVWLARLEREAAQRTHPAAAPLSDEERRRLEALGYSE